jgi:hypothetical protein
MEVDPEDDEIIRPDAKKRRKLPPGSMVVPASKAEEAEAEQLAAAQRAARKAGKVPDERNKRKIKLGVGKTRSVDGFGATFGDAYKGKKGAKGDVTKTSGVQPYAYLPLNPRLLGKKQQKQASATMDKLLGPSAKKRNAAGVGKKSKLVGKHGLQQRREKNRRANKK